MHGSGLDKAAEYRVQAENIRIMAQQISLNESRNKMLDSARHLELLANEEERKAGRIASLLELKTGP